MSLRQIYSTVFAALILACICLLSSGCMGGGTIGTGLGSGKAWGGGTAAGAKTSASVSYFDLHGELRDSSGRPLSYASLTVATPRASEETSSGSSGAYSVPVIQGRGERIRIKVVHQGRVWRGSYTRYRAGENRIRLEIVARPDGTLAFRE